MVKYHWAKNRIDVHVPIAGMGSQRRTGGRKKTAAEFVSRADQNIGIKFDMDRLKGKQREYQRSIGIPADAALHAERHEMDMTKGESWLNGRMPVCRRSVVSGLGAAGALAGMTLLSRWGFADDYDAMYAQAAIDWKQFAGQTISLAGATHPWSKAIGPLLPQFTKTYRYQCRQRIPAGNRVSGRSANQACPWQHDARRLHVLWLWPGHRGGMARAAGRPLFGRVADRSGLV